MTTTITLKTAVIGTLILALFVPAMSFAATPTVADLQTQYQTLMSQFEQLKSERRGPNASGTKATSTKDRMGKASTTVDRTCMAAAAATRESAIKTAWTTFTSSVTTALDKRGTALASAWGASTDGNREAVKKAWTDWKKDKTAANSKLKNDRKAAWDAFKKTAKESCKVTTPKEEGLERSGSDSIAL
ncbi:MAG: hypothetical protein MUF19_00040 [Candidatus Pacebacteria bacterium]|jgi:hypothetical protein|nr:hypothetical protein [Candidatus Paceibacterota bacterium]